MKYILRTIVVRPRGIAIFIAFICYLILMVVKIQYSFASHISDTWINSAFYCFVSLLFFVAGSFVWEYARDRRVAFFLYGFSLSMVLVYLGKIGVTEGENKILFFAGTAGGFTAAYFFNHLLSILPQKHFSSAPLHSTGEDLSPRKRQQIVSVAVKCYLAFLVLYCVALISACASIAFLPASPILSREQLVVYIKVYYIITFVGLITLSCLSYIQSTRTRERQQTRLFICGLVLSVCPLFVLTVLPVIFGFSSVPISLSFIPSVFFPIFLAYTILRYQVIFLDSYISRAISCIIAVVCLALFAYIVVLACYAFFRDTVTVYVLGGVVVLTTVLSPSIWHMAQLVTEQIFFKDTKYYRRLIEKPAFFAEEEIDVEKASELITSVALHTFEITQACLFVFDESYGYYRVLPICTDDPVDAPRKALMEAVLRILKSSANDSPVKGLQAEHPAMLRLDAARRPMLLSEVLHPENEHLSGMRRFLVTDPVSDKEDWLLAPVRVQGRMIGVLVLGERKDKQCYAGPDFEAAQFLVARFSSILETARLYERSSQHAALLNSLYTVSTMPGYTFKTVDDAAQAYAMVAANAAAAQVEVWRYDPQEQVMRYCTAAGHYPALAVATEESTSSLEEGDWNSWFFDGDAGSDWQQLGAPSCLLACSRRPAHALAWLPLQKHGRRLGALLLLYPRPHRFTRVDKRVWEMFADQCAAILENVRMTSDLLAAYERQKELDTLKDQFITVASHELRTPLTAVQGYIELLCEHKDILSHDAFIEFAEKARLGCDELALLVGNIIDASTIHSDVKGIQQRSLSLYRAVSRVLDILGATIEREGRRVSVAVDAKLRVAADRTRLHQVLLNLLTNALRYSPEGSPIEISARCVDNLVCVVIRDYGSGIPSDQQHLLFERFVRLERDMNSSVRGAGLGLYLSKQLIEAMGGRIWVESSGVAGEGSSFIFELQLAPLDQPSGSLLSRLHA